MFGVIQMVQLFRLYDGGTSPNFTTSITANVAGTYILTVTVGACSSISQSVVASNKLS